MKEIKVTAPLYFTLGVKKPKRHYINLNGYRNWHFLVSNKLKAMYKDAVKSQLEGIKLNTPIILSFHLVKPTLRKTDRSNPLSIHEKFFCDALVELGCIPDDNDDYIEKTDGYTSSYEKGNGRVEITIRTPR